MSENPVTVKLILFKETKKITKKKINFFFQKFLLMLKKMNEGARETPSNENSRDKCRVNKIFSK